MTKNLNDLGMDLMKVYDELREETISIDKAKALSKVAGSVIQTSRVLLDYAIFKNSGTFIKEDSIPLIEQNVK